MTPHLYWELSEAIAWDVIEAGITVCFPKATVVEDARKRKAGYLIHAWDKAESKKLTVILSRLKADTIT